MSFRSYCDVLSGKMKGGELDLSIGGSLEFEMWPLHSKMKADECKLVGLGLTFSPNGSVMTFSFIL